MSMTADETTPITPPVDPRQACLEAVKALKSISDDYHMQRATTALRALSWFVICSEAGPVSEHDNDAASWLVGDALRDLSEIDRRQREEVTPVLRAGAGLRAYDSPVEPVPLCTVTPL